MLLLMEFCSCSDNWFVISPFGLIVDIWTIPFAFFYYSNQIQLVICEHIWDDVYLFFDNVVWCYIFSYCLICSSFLEVRAVALRNKLPDRWEQLLVGYIPVKVSREFELCCSIWIAEISPREDRFTTLGSNSQGITLKKVVP